MKAERQSQDIDWQMIFFGILMLFLTLGIVSHPAAANDFLYVNNNGQPNAVSAFSVGSDGSLTPVPGAPFPTGGLGGICVDIGSTKTIHRHGGFLYATNYTSGNVSGFAINNDGSLTPVPGSPFPASPGGHPIGVASSPNQQLLFVGRGLGLSGGGFGIDVYQINPDGSLTLIPGSPFGVGQGAGFDVLFDAVDKTVISDANSSEVAVFNVTNTGTLVPIPGSPFQTPTFGDHKMDLGPQASCLYVAGGGDPAVSAMQVFDDGALANAPGSPVATGQPVAGAATTQQGNFAYFGGASSIVGFKITNTCQMTPIPGSPFTSGGRAPLGVTTEGNGKFLFAVNSFSFNVSSFQIASNGALTLAATAPLQGAAICPTGLSAYPVIGGPPPVR